MHQPRLNMPLERRIYSVSQIVNEVRFELENRFGNLWVKGEVSNFKRYPSGHCYFTLKDRDAQISAVCFRMQAQYLRFVPEDGMDIIVRGTVSVYPVRGQLQFIVEVVEPVGEGALQVAFEQLKKRLQEEGLFEPRFKKKLPLLPSKVGIVTSISGAAVEDILRVLKRRDDRLSVLIFPARVQGSEAAREISRGIRYFNRRKDIDVIIVARGGGSLEDLWAFNEESVARAIFDSTIPVISAVGHEIDFTIADFVADVRAATPSAAAELVATARRELFERVEGLANRALQSIRLLLQRKEHEFQRLAASRAFVDAESRLRLFAQRLDELRARLARTLPERLVPLGRLLSLGNEELRRQTTLYLERQRVRIEALTTRLQAYSPLSVLERGYAIVTTDNGEIVRLPEQVAEGQRISLRVWGGSFRARREENGI